MSATRLQVIQDLKERLRKLERTDSPRAGRESVISTGVSTLDQLLPDGGLGAGTLLEWLNANEGSGATTLALILAARVQEQRGAMVVIDERREFYPPAASALGVSLARTLVVQPKNARDALWAWEQSLRSWAVGVVLGWQEKINDRLFRRLQLAAETGESLGFLLRPASARIEPSWAAARLLVEGRPSDHEASAAARRWRVEMLHCRGGCSGKAIELEVSDEANDVHLVPSVAHSARPGRAAGA